MPDYSLHTLLLLLSTTQGHSHRMKSKTSNAFITLLQCRTFKGIRRRSQLPYTEQEILHVIEHAALTLYSIRILQVKELLPPFTPEQTWLEITIHQLILRVPNQYTTFNDMATFIQILYLIINDNLLTICLWTFHTPPIPLPTPTPTNPYQTLNPTTRTHAFISTFACVLSLTGNAQIRTDDCYVYFLPVLMILFWIPLSILRGLHGVPSVLLHYLPV